MATGRGARAVAMVVDASASAERGLSEGLPFYSGSAETRETGVVERSSDVCALVEPKFAEAGAKARSS
jgi:hypothetical protein